MVPPRGLAVKVGGVVGAVAPAGAAGIDYLLRWHVVTMVRVRFSMVKKVVAFTGSAESVKRVTI
jgi:hypothetical protein